MRKTYKIISSKHAAAEERSDLRFKFCPADDTDERFNEETLGVSCAPPEHWWACGGHVQSRDPQQRVEPLRPHRALTAMAL